MTGDRLDTDIEFGLQGGLTTCLVLSGNLVYIFITFFCWGCS